MTPREYAEKVIDILANIDCDLCPEDLIEPLFRQAVAEEREACAKVCFDFKPVRWLPGYEAASILGNRIRGMGNHV